MPLSFKEEYSMVSGAYLRQQAEVLIALSRATFDLSIAGRLREMRRNLEPRPPGRKQNAGFDANNGAQRAT